MINWIEYKREFKYNLKLATPVIAGMIGHTLVGIVDNIMVGQLGVNELAAVSLGNSFVFVGMSLGIGFSTAITPLVAQFAAENNISKTRKTFQSGLFLCTLLGVFTFLLLLLSKPLIGLMKQDAIVINLAKPYLDIVAFSLIPLIMYQAYKQFSDGMTYTKYAMYATILSNVVNIVINYLLIFGKFGCPKLGVVGAAIGTLISRIVMLIFIHYLIKNNEILKPLINNFSWKRISKIMSFKIIILGIPSAFQMLFEVVLFTGAILLCGKIGPISQAANQIALSLASVTFMFAMGLSVAAMIRIGHYKGLGDYVSLKKVATSIFILTLLFEIVFAFVFFFFYQELPFIFFDSNDLVLNSNKSEVLAIASQLLIIAALFQISDGLQVVVLGALRGLQDVILPTYFTFISYWLIGFPVSIYLGLFTEYKAKGVWIGLLTGLTSAAIFLLLRFYSLTNKLIKNQLKT
jgi:MATE family multidrug resistance protein